MAAQQAALRPITQGRDLRAPGTRAELIRQNQERERVAAHAAASSACGGCRGRRITR
jgi:hypothetical protein